MRNATSNETLKASSYTLLSNTDGHWSPPRNRLSRRHESVANKPTGHRGTLSGRRAGVCLLFATILCLWNPLAAQEPGYQQRRVVTTHGAITFVGNSLGLNKDSTLDAPGTSGSLGTFTTTDTNQRDQPQWPLGTTGDWRLNSSSAVVSVQSGSRVIHAELIWGGSYLFGTEDVSDFLNDPINFTTPAGTTQVTRDPTTAVERSGAQQNYYVRTANVTALVSAAGNGTYTVGRVPATQGQDEVNFNAAGWTLAILYENANLPTRSLSLFLGLEPQGGATASVTGICTTDKKGQLRARVAVSAVEGDTNDPNDTRDSLRFGPSIDLSPDQFRLSGPNNPAANFFASQINRDDGELDTRGTFGDRNNDFQGLYPWWPPGLGHHQRRCLCATCRRADHRLRPGHGGVRRLLHQRAGDADRGRRAGFRRRRRNECQ